MGDWSFHINVSAEKATSKIVANEVMKSQQVSLEWKGGLESELLIFPEEPDQLFSRSTLGSDPKHG